MGRTINYFNDLKISANGHYLALGARVVMLVLISFLLFSCKPQAKPADAAAGSGAGGSDGSVAGGAIIPRPNTWVMTMTSHTDGASYNATTMYYGSVKGTASASGGVSGFVRLTWQTYVDNVLKFSGTGGWGITKKPNDTFYGEWTANSIRLTDGVNNKVRIIAEDQIGNSVSKEFYVFTDASAPELFLDPPVTFTKAYWTQGASILLSGTATDTVAIQEIRWANVTTGLNGVVTGTAVWSQNIALNAGVNLINLTSEDPLHNTRARSVTIGRDNVLPVISMTAPTATGRLIRTDTTPVNLAGTASDADSGLDRIFWTNSATGGSGSGSGLSHWSVTGVPVVQGTNTITVTAVDRVGLTKSTAVDYIVDLVSPSPTAASFAIAAGAVSTNSNPVPYTISATDAETKITHICLRYNSTLEPGANDPCWTTLATPAQNLIYSSSFPIGTAPGLYNVYAWFKDEAGHISGLTNSGAGTPGRDKESIQYVPGNPPNIAGVLVSNTDTPSDPPTQAQRTIAASGIVYIKWRVTDVEGLAGSPISLQFTTNETTWNNIALGITNTSGTGCVADNVGSTADNGFTGCYKWSGAAVPGTYFKVRVTAKDLSNMTSSVTAAPLNALKFTTLAGNTDTGIDGSASSAVLFHNLPMPLLPDAQSMAVNNAGVIYIRDLNRGILMVNPADGLLKVLVKKDASLANNNGDNGAVTSATVKYPTAIALDENENVLVMDYGRIRRINLNYSTPTIETLIGGGVNTADYVADPLQVSISLAPVDGGAGTDLYSSIKMPFFALPNGDIIFTDRDALYGQTPAGTHRIRYYDKGTREVTTIRPSGTGTKSAPAQAISACAIYGFAFRFDQSSSDFTDLYYACGGSDIFRANPTTYASEGPHPNLLGADQTYTSMMRTYQNNSVYAFGKLFTYAKRLNTDGTWTTVLGNGAEGGSCPDGTLATACPVQLLDFYVAKNGKTYFMEMGKIRMFDEANKVVTIVGQGTDYGDGGKAISARMGNTDFLGQWLNAGTPTIDFLDYQSKKIREFPVGGNIAKLAGDGGGNSPANNAAAATSGLMVHSSGAFWTSFSVNYNNGEILTAPSPAYIAKLNRGTGQWNYVVGGGATNYYGASTGVLGANIALPGYPSNLVGFAPATNMALMYVHTWSGAVHYNAFYKTLNTAGAYAMAHVAGSGNGVAVSQTAWCAPGTALATCTVPYTHGHYVLNSYDAFTPRWAVADYSSSKVYVLPAGGNLTVLKDLSTLTTVGARVLVSYAYRHESAAINMLYYCATNGKLYKYDLVANPADATELTVNLPNYSCTGRAMTYNPTRTSLIFLYKQNGLNAIGEYFSP